LIAKYQNNPKCHSVSNIIIPVCGDKERQVKIEGDGVRIPALFKKSILPIVLFKPCVADDKGRRNISVEFFKRGGEWYGAFSYRTPAAPALSPPALLALTETQSATSRPWPTRKPARFCILGLTRRLPKQYGEDERQSSKNKGKTACCSRLSENSHEERSTKITSYPK